MLDDLDPAVVAFPGLNDTPTSYVGHAAKVVAVKATEDGLEYVTASGLLGDVVGPAVSVDDAIVRWNTTSGKLVASSGIRITDTPDLLWTVDGSGGIGTAGANRPSEVHTSGQVVVGTAVSVGTTLGVTGVSTLTGGILVDGIAAGISLSGAKAIGAAPTEATGLVLRNSTPAAAGAGAQQYSPATYWAGQGWKNRLGARQGDDLVPQRGFDPAEIDAGTAVADAQESGNGVYGALTSAHGSTVGQAFAA